MHVRDRIKQNLKVLSYRDTVLSALKTKKLLYAVATKSLLPTCIAIASHINTTSADQSVSQFIGEFYFTISFFFKILIIFDATVEGCVEQRTA